MGLGECMNTGITIFAVTGLVLVLSASALAQTNTGEIGGVVRDESGGVLPGATVVALHPASGFMVERVTDLDGRFFMSSLPIGQWNVTAELPGFRRAVQTGIVLAIGRTIDVQFSLHIGQVSEEITVVASAPLLQSTTAEISDVIDNRLVERIPLNGRQFLQLAQLSDAVVIPPGGTRGAALQQAGPLPNVGGQRAGHNIYLLDGVKVTDELFNNLVINPSIDSIQEFKIQKSMYPPEFGGKASALINVATKSGANVFSGSGFAFIRDERFDAHNFFDPKAQPVPPLAQGQFGGTLGGPIIQDRTFFFISYEGQRTDRSLTKTFSVPSEAARGGDFSGFAPICDPLTIDPSTGACGSFFPGNQIPAGRIDPIAAAFFEQVPLATESGEIRNLTSIETLDRNIDQFSVRVDHRFGATDQLLARFSTFGADELQPFGTSVLQESLVPGFGRTLDTTTRNLGVSYTKTFGTNMLNEFRFGWMSVDGGQHSLNAGDDFAQRVGLGGVTLDPRDTGFPQVSTAGLYSVMGDPTTFVVRENEHFELYNNFLLDRGEHRIKFGGYLFHLRFRPENPDTARGSFTYTGQFSGNALADFLLGYPVAGRSGIGGRGSEDARTTWLHMYAQDDWRPRDNLTVNFGLRYEINQHMTDVENRLSSIDFSVPGGRYVIASDDDGNISPDAAALLPLIPIPWVTSAEIGWDNSLLRPSKKRFAPRLGFALTLGDEAQDGRARWLRDLPQPVGVQRPNLIHTESAVLFSEAGRCPDRAAGADAAHERHPDGGPDRGHRRGDHGSRLQGRVHADLERRDPDRDHAQHRVRGLLHGVVHHRRGQLHDSECAGPGSGRPLPAPRRAGAGRHSRDPVRREVDLPRRDVQRGPPTQQQHLVQRRVHVVEVERRRVESRCHGLRI